MNLGRLLAVVTTASLALPTLGCGKLTKKKARKLLLEDIYGAGIAECTWSEPRRETQTRFIFDDRSTVSRCGDQLYNNGLIDSGACIASFGGPNECYRRIVRPTDISKIDDTGKLSFPCGTYELHEVTSITTDGNKAKATFERTFTEDRELLDKLSQCKLGIPALGRAKIAWDFTRDDSGTWTISK